MSDEGLVDLELAHRQPAQVRERGLAHTKVIDGKVDTLIRQAPQHRDRRVGLAHDGALGDLQRDLRGRDAVRAKQTAEAVGKFGVIQVTRGDVDGNADRMALGLPEARLGNAGDQCPARHAPDVPGFLGERDEGVGGYRADDRMPPSHQALSAVDASCLEVQFGLVV